MTKQDLVKTVSAQTGLKNNEVKEVIERVVDVIRDEVNGGESVYLRGFGTFAKKHRAAKVARNISQGTIIQIPAREVPNFKPSKQF